MTAASTPSTEHVRQVYAAHQGAMLTDKHAREFDRWLADHDRTLLAAIEQAPHGLDINGRQCELVWSPSFRRTDRCTCWKADVLEGSRSSTSG